MFVWNPSIYLAAQRLLAVGTSAESVSEALGVPRSTIQRWRDVACPRHERRALAAGGWRPRDPTLYCYALGLYLGDGNIVRQRAFAAFLQVHLDRRYSALVDEAENALNALFEDARTRRYDRAALGKVVLQLSHPALPFAFPQHGPGRKHERPIVLTAWQRELTHAHPGALVRGLIHSDGCRTINRFTTKLPSGRTQEYAYPRYFFSNESADIRAIFCEHVEVLGVRWSQSNRRNISISDKKSVAILDEVVGPKR